MIVLCFSDTGLLVKYWGKWNTAAMPFRGNPFGDLLTVQTYKGPRSRRPSMIFMYMTICTISICVIRYTYLNDLVQWKPNIILFYLYVHGRITSAIFVQRIKVIFIHIYREVIYYRENIFHLLHIQRTTLTVIDLLIND